MSEKGTEPCFVHCDDCHHEWIAAYLPMEADKVARLFKQNAMCPMCAGKKVLMGRYPHATPEGDPIAWISGGDTGRSSKTIWSVMMNRIIPDQYFRPSVPFDPSDFGRCYRLLTVMPSWRTRLSEVSAKYGAWKPLVDAWDELTALYEEELPNKTAPKLYARMEVLRGVK